MIKMNAKSIAATILILVFANACSNKSEDVLAPSNGNACDTANVSYAQNVLPIISSNCYSCHGNGSIAGGVNLDGYDNIKIQAANGALEGSVTHASGFTPMPLNQPKLSDCEVNTITAWINQNMPNN